MSEQSPCCADPGEGTDDQSDESNPDPGTDPDRWLTDDSVLSAPLPSDMQRQLSRFLESRVETMDDALRAMREAVCAESLTVEMLCHSDTETPHRATTASESYHFKCFFDGVALASLADEAVEIQTETPAGTGIDLSVSPEFDIEAQPSDAVMAFGIAPDVEGGDTSFAEIYSAICPYVKAFSSRESYETWAAAVDAATVGMPLADGVPIAATLTDDG